MWIRSIADGPLYFFFPNCVAFYFIFIITYLNCVAFELCYIFHKLHFILFLTSLIISNADGPQHPVRASSLPSCLWSRRTYLPISPRFMPYDFISRCKFSILTTRQPMVEFYLLTFPRFPLQKKEHKSYFGKNRTHDFCTSRCAGYLLDQSGDERALRVLQTKTFVLRLRLHFLLFFRGATFRLSPECLVPLQYYQWPRPGRRIFGSALLMTLLPGTCNVQEKTYFFSFFLLL